MRTTVAIPLHASAPWLDNVVGVVERLAGVADIVVSDATGVDDAFVRLRGRVGDGVTWLGPRPSPLNWVEHCNDLRMRCETPYFMWLAHDDMVDGAWIAEAEAALDGDPGVVAAVGRVVAEPPEHLHGLVFDPDFASPDAATRCRAALVDLVTGRGGSVGLLFRAVLRRDAVPPLPAVPAGEWADAPWAVRLLARGRAATTTGRYVKRWHPASASAAWSALNRSPALRETWFPWALEELGADAASVLAAAWDAEARAMARDADSARNHAEMLERELRREQAFGQRVRAMPAWRAAAALRRWIRSRG